MAFKREYKEFATECVVLPKVEEFLNERKINPDKIFYDSYTWYERVLFEALDSDNDGLPDNELGKNFQVIFNGVITCIDRKDHPGFMDKSVKIDERKVVLESKITVKDAQPPFAVIFKVLKTV